LAQSGVPVLDHPPYSPDLAPADIFLFPRLKNIMKGARFADVATIQERETAVLRSIPTEAFADSFQKLYERYQKCVVKNGDYFEGQ
jgi:histone-lysine N-methyltransferase SETMAR